MEHQKSVYIAKNVENGTLVFQEYSKNYFFLTCRKKVEDAQTRKGKVRLQWNFHQPIPENLMAKNYGHIQILDHNSPQTKHRKDFMSSKEKHNCAIFADFSP